LTSTAEVKNWEDYARKRVEAFLSIRSNRPVLRELLAPSSVLDSFQEFHVKWDDEAAHCSVLLLAYEKQRLDSFCFPLEELIFNRRGGVSALTPQYQADLKEDWYLGKDAKRREARCNKFLGKFYEFHAALALENHFGWQLTDMEAFTQKSAPTPRADFTFTPQVGETIAVSCKTLCQSPEMFDLNCNALANNGVSVSWISPYAPVDYLELRIREAVEGLQQFDNQRRVVLIQLLHPENFKLQLEDNWVDISNLCSENDVDGIVISSAGGFELEIIKEHWF
jgi:hypothetical protein